MARKTAREVSMKLLYEWAMGGQDNPDQTIHEMLDEESLDVKDKEYIYGVVLGVQTHIDEIDQIIQKYAIGWKIGRMARVDLSILRLALYEMLYRDDIPKSVSVNEAVELAKKYSNPESGAFVNGILGNFLRQSEPQNE